MLSIGLNRRVFLRYRLARRPTESYLKSVQRLR